MSVFRGCVVCYVLHQYLRLPDFDRPFVLEPDASDVAVGAVLLQEYEDGLHPVAYFSKKYIPAERNYHPGTRQGVTRNI